MRDSQRQAVYKWHWTLRGMYPPTPLSLSDCRALVERIYSHCPGLVVPRIVTKRGEKWAFYDEYRHVIRLPVAGQNALVVCHEVAHAFVRDAPWHGPRFATLVAELWEDHAGIPQSVSRPLGETQKPRKVLFDNRPFCVRL